jgi:hypothetical protein
MLAETCQTLTAASVFLQVLLEPLVEMVGADFGQLRNLALEEVVGIRHHFVIDLDALPGLQLCRVQLASISRSRVGWCSSRGRSALIYTLQQLRLIGGNVGHRKLVQYLHESLRRALQGA